MRLGKVNMYIDAIFLGLLIWMCLMCGIYFAYAIFNDRKEKREKWEFIEKHYDVILLRKDNDEWCDIQDIERDLNW